MHMRPLAHSAKPEKGVPAQPYADHVHSVDLRAREAAIAATQSWTGDRSLFQDVVALAARWHDLGKLDSENQSVLAGQTRKKLPVKHEYAGVRHLREQNHGEAATLVFSHHRGLPNLSSEFIESPLFENASDSEARQRAKTLFSEYLYAHQAELSTQPPTPVRQGNWMRSLDGWSGLTWRFALSCLVDADHSDTARHYRTESDAAAAPTRWTERRAALDAYIDRLSTANTGDPDRNRLRNGIYQACRNVRLEPDLRACDSGVGTGKTTAVMAHLLRVAEERNLRHIFVVLPYTNIINQAVEVYRNALLLEGEDPERVIAAHHHQVDFRSRELRQLATLWDCPIIVTTAVQFFETLATGHPSKLRKLHELPRSAVFIDEAHAALPAWLWPQTWLWLKELALNWGCHFVLASGSLVRFWEHKDFADPPVTIPDLVPEHIRAENGRAEQRRIIYRRKPEPMRISGLIDFVGDQPGPRLVVANTIRSAAEIARAMRHKNPETFHLSTALAPVDRERIIERIKQRFNARANPDWTLVATSCVESGVDLDFRCAVRELSSTASMVQIGGRVNRHESTNQQNAAVWVVSFDDPHLTRNPAMKIPGRVLDRLFATGAVERLAASELCTQALQRELNETSQKERIEKITKPETTRNFPELAKNYRVIEDETALVLVNPLLERFEGGERLRPSDIVRGSVRIRVNALQKLNVRSLHGSDEMYAWTLDYDPDFLGYMKGVLDSASALAGEFLNV